MKRTLPELLTAVFLAITLSASSCALIGPPGTFDPDGPRDLVGMVVLRTRGYVEADEELPAVDRNERLLALEQLTATVMTSEPVSLAAFKAASFEPFAWHDAYVAGAPGLEPYQRDSDLLSTEILRTHYWPPEDGP